MATAYRAEHVGSLLRPPYLLRAREAYETGELTTAQLREVEDRAIAELLDIQKQAGLTVFTDGAGFYSATGLVPGMYTIKVTAPSFLPALREKIGLRPGASVNVNVTLNTLLGVMQLGPLRTVPDDDDWKWTLRSVANRPILRVFGSGSAGGRDGRQAQP